MQKCQLSIQKNIHLFFKKERQLAVGRGSLKFYQSVTQTPRQMMNLPVENTTTSGLNFTEAAEATANPEVTMNELPCGYLDIEKFNTIQSCSFWVEGVSMSILGIGAIITNAISIYVFTRYCYNSPESNTCSVSIIL